MRDLPGAKSFVPVRANIFPIDRRRIAVLCPLQAVKTLATGCLIAWRYRVVASEERRFNCINPAVGYTNECALSRLSVHRTVLSRLAITMRLLPAYRV